MSKGTIGCLCVGVSVACIHDGTEVWVLIGAVLLMLGINLIARDPIKF